MKKVGIIYIERNDCNCYCGRGDKSLKDAWEAASSPPCLWILDIAFSFPASIYPFSHLNKSDYV